VIKATECVNYWGKAASATKGLMHLTICFGIRVDSEMTQEAEIWHLQFVRARTALLTHDLCAHPQYSHLFAKPLIGNTAKM